MQLHQLVIQSKYGLLLLILIIGFLRSSWFFHSAKKKKEANRSKTVSDYSSKYVGKGERRINENMHKKCKRNRKYPYAGDTPLRSSFLMHLKSLSTERQNKRHTHIRTDAAYVFMPNSETNWFQLQIAAFVNRTDNFSLFLHLQITEFFCLFITKNWTKPLRPLPRFDSFSLTFYFRAVHRNFCFLY